MTQQEMKVLEKFEDLSETLIKRRMDLHFSQHDVAAMTGLTQPQVSDSEKLKRAVKLDTFIKLADGLGLEVQLVPKRK